MTVKVKIAKRIVERLREIRKGDRVPGQPQGSDERFEITPKLVTRALQELKTPSTQMPAILIAHPETRYRHLLADVLAATMEVFISGIVYTEATKGTDRGASILEIDKLYDATMSIVGANHTWNGLARRTRIVRNDENTETEEPLASFSLELQVDFIEMQDVVEDKQRLSELSAGDNDPVPGQSKFGQIMAALHNAFIATEGISWVERPSIWPIPLEQIPRVKTPGIFFHEVNEVYHYLASTDVDKRVSAQIVYVAIAPADEGRFANAIDTHVARIKDVIGKFADLEDRVNTIDIESVRTHRSEFPVVVVDIDIQIRYYQSFLES